MIPSSVEFLNSQLNQFGFHVTIHHCSTRPAWNLQLKTYGHFLPIPRSHGLAKGLYFGFAFKLYFGFTFKLYFGFAFKLYFGFTSMLYLGFISQDLNPLLPLHTFDVQGQQFFEAFAPLVQPIGNTSDNAKKAPSRPILRLIVLSITANKSRTAKTRYQCH